MPRNFNVVLYAPTVGRQTWNFSKGRVTVGSDADSDVVVLHESVAAQHLVLLLGSERVGVEDVGNLGEVKVDGEVILHWKAVNYPASIKVGEFVLAVYRMEEASVPAEQGGGNGENGDVVLVGGGSRPAGVPERNADLSVEVGLVESMVYFPLVREIGRGGMGSIYEGIDSQLNRTVAVKVSNRGELGTDIQIQDDVRFLSEAEMLSRLAHPNIVPIYSVGRESGGRPVYSMKLVKGKSLQNVIDGLRDGSAEYWFQFSRERLLTVFLKVCDAVAFAHSKGILHRDLKPENVMLGEFGEVLVMDWGLAKVIGAKEGLRREGETGALPERGEPRNAVPNLSASLDGDVIGTPQYMSPEQAAGRIFDLDERSDIYALGAILYATLTLRPPVKGASVDEILAKVREGQITPINEPLGSAERSSQYLELGAEIVPEGLQAVVRKALAFAPQDRYQSVADLEADIHAFQGGFATGAENATFFWQLVLLLRRHRAEAALVGVLLISVVIFTLRLASSERNAMENERVAKVNAKSAEEAAVRAKEQRRLAMEEKEEVRRSAAQAQIAVAEAAERDHNGGGMKRALLSVPEDLRDQVWDYLWKMLDTSFFKMGSPSGASFLAVTADPVSPSVFITLERDGWVRRVNVRTGHVDDLFNAGAAVDEGTTAKIAVSPNGQYMAVAVVRYDGRVQTPERPTSLYRLQDGVEVVRFPTIRGVTSLKYSPDGKLLLVNLIDRVQIYEVPSGVFKWEGGIAKEWSVSAWFSEDGGKVLVHSGEGMLEVDSSNGTLLRTLFKPGWVNWLMPGVHRAYMFCYDNGVLSKRSIEDGAYVFQNRPAGESLLGGGILMKSGALLTALTRSDGDSVLQLWNEDTGTLLRSVLCLEGVSQLAIHPLTDEAVSLKAATLRAWSFEMPQPTRSFVVDRASIRNKEVCNFLGGPDLFMRVAKSKDKAMHLDVLKFEPQSTEERVHVTLGPEFFKFLSSSVMGEVLALSGGKGHRMVEVYRREGEVFTKLGSWEVEQDVMHLRVSPSGDKFWTGRYVVDANLGSVLATMNRNGVGTYYGGLSQWLGSKRIVECARIKDVSKAKETPAVLERSLVVWDAETGQKLLTKAAPFCVALCASPDGLLIAEGGTDNRIRVRDASTLEVVREFRAHDQEVTGLAWHPTLPCLVSVSEDLRIKVWDTRTFHLLEEIDGVPSRPEQLVLSPYGGAVAVYCGRESRVHFWVSELLKGVKGSEEAGAK